ARCTDPFAGEAMLTSGGSLMTSVIASMALKLPLSVTEAVIVCAPGESAEVLMEPPVPTKPSRLESHSIAGERSPSCLSLATAPNWIEAPALCDEPFFG